MDPLVHIALVVLGAISLASLLTVACLLIWAAWLYFRDREYSQGVVVLALAALVLILIIVGGGHVCQAEAFTALPTGTEVTATWDEPTTNEDGSPLTDLAKVSLYFRIDGIDAKAKDIPASRPEGGGIGQTTTFVVPVLAGQEKVVNVWGTASDASGNESKPSNTVNVRIDRLAPATLK